MRSNSAEDTAPGFREGRAAGRTGSCTTARCAATPSQAGAAACPCCMLAPTLPQPWRPTWVAGACRINASNTLQAWDRHTTSSSASPSAASPPGSPAAAATSAAGPAACRACWCACCCARCCICCCPPCRCAAGAWPSGGAEVRIGGRPAGAASGGDGGEGRGGRPPLCGSSELARRCRSPRVGPSSDSCSPPCSARRAGSRCSC